MQPLLPLTQIWNLTSDEVDTLRPSSVGLINETWFVGEPTHSVLQALHPIFGNAVHQDIERITRHIEGKGMVTPLLIPTKEGRLSFVADDDRIWRLQTFLPGKTFERIQSPRMAYSAGGLVAKWHGALDDLEHVFAFERAGVHDTTRHFQKLEACLSSFQNHRLFQEVEPWANRALEAWSTWDGRMDKPLRICHGDLKLSNIRFGNEENALALIDLDTMGYLTLDEELGDAWRSWCNSGTEDQLGGTFNLEIFEASLLGYCEAKTMPAEAFDGLEFAAERIALELSARFLCDALEESYFGWDSKAFPSRGEHNLHRGKVQVLYAESIASQRTAMRRIVCAAAGHLY